MIYQQIIALIRGDKAAVQYCNDHIFDLVNLHEQGASIEDLAEVCRINK